MSPEVTKLIEDVLKGQTRETGRDFTPFVESLKMIDARIKADPLVPAAEMLRLYKAAHELIAPPPVPTTNSVPAPQVDSAMPVTPPSTMPAHAPSPPCSEPGPPARTHEQVSPKQLASSITATTAPRSVSSSSHANTKTHSDAILTRWDGQLGAPTNTPKALKSKRGRRS